MMVFVQALVATTKRALVIADLPFGTYQVSSEQALESAIHFVKLGGAQAIKLEGGAIVERQVRKITRAGIPVMGHIGLTPQSVHASGGYRVQGRSDKDGEKLLQDALTLEDAGAFAIVLEAMPAELCRTITEKVNIPTVGVGGGHMAMLN